MPQTHVLKCWSLYWDAIARGEKTFEVRFNDRPYVVGDILELHRIESDPHLIEQRTSDPVAANAEPPEPLLRRITHVMPGGLEFAGHKLVDARAVVMSIAPVGVPKQSPDAAMVVHLRETLESIREQIAVELSPHPAQRQKLIAHMIAEIDEALQ
jgi:hypothetical protein